MKSAGEAARASGPTIMLEIRLPDVESAADSQAAYDALYGEAEISQRDSYYLWLASLLQLRDGDRYLDISCGEAQLAALARTAGASSYGLDLAPAALRQGRQRTALATLVAGNSQQLPYASGSFDVVSNIGSLEHFQDMAAAMRELARVLKPGGRAYVLVPNTFSLLTNIWIAWRQGRTSIDRQPIQRYAARREWQQLLEAPGLKVTKTYKYERERPRTWPDFVNLLRHPKTLLRVLLGPLVPLNLSFCFLFVLVKPAAAGGRP